jgi:ABC-type lipoprotein release transport system permease subunit
MFHQPDAIILPVNVADYLGVRVGDILVVEGKGKDHQVEMEVVGLVKRMAGFWSIDGNRQSIRWGNGIAFVSSDTFLRLRNDPVEKDVCPDKVCTAAERDAPVIDRIFATTDATVPSTVIAKNVRTTFADRDDVRINITEEDIQQTRQSFKSMRIVLLVLTVLSLVTSVMGVFSVIYITVQTRRIEIGLLKAIGITGKQLVGILAIESLAMTTSATLAGAAAGTGLGYLFYISQNMMMQEHTPIQPAFDGLTVGSVLVMVIISSLTSAVFASRGIVKQRVTEILRGV